MSDQANIYNLSVTEILHQANIYNLSVTEILHVYV